MAENKFKLADILNGIIIPLVLVLLIFLLAIFVNPGGQYHVLGVGVGIGVIGVILTQGFAQMIVLGIPLALGLLWNKWAGGAAGFIMGGMYYVANAGLYTGYYTMSTAPYHNFYGDPSQLFWIVYGVIIGYMAGALNNGSSNFKRMLGAGLTAAVTSAFLQLYMNYNWSLDFAGAQYTAETDFSPRAMAHNLWAVAGTGVHDASGNLIPAQYDAGSFIYGFTIAFIPMIALGVIVPIIAKVMTWYGIQPMKHQ